MEKDPADLLSKLERIDDLERSQREPLPRLFGNYTLLASLGKGGMGEVFLAKSGAVEGFEKHCVVKTLRPHLTDDREYVARFIDEARVVVQLNHKNVCQVFDVGLVGERYYLAMELIAGQDLRTLQDMVCGAGGGLEPALVVHIMAEVLEALDYAHRLEDVQGNPLQLVHRDISPQNVMCSYEGEVKLIDFGLAASSVKIEKTSPNLVMGKLAYMSPEQIRGEIVDRSVDIFAAAVMLTELMLGHRFYEGLSTHETWTSAAKGGHRPAGYEGLDPALRVILDKALAVHRADRYQDGLALRSALLSWRQAQNLWSDGPALRTLMHEVFAKAAAGHRTMLQQTTQEAARLLSSSSSSPVGSPSGASLAVRGSNGAALEESSRSLVRSPSSSSSSSSSSPSPDGGRRSQNSAQPAIGESGTLSTVDRPRRAASLAPQEETRAVMAAAFDSGGRRRRWLTGVAAGLLAGVVVAAGIWVVTDEGPPRDVDASVASKSSVDGIDGIDGIDADVDATKATKATKDTTGRPDPASAGVIAGEVAADGQPSPDPAVAVPVGSAGGATGPGAGGDLRKKKTLTGVGPTTRDTSPSTSPSTPPSDSKVDSKPPKVSKSANDRWEDAPPTRRVELLQRTCGRLACTTDLAGRVETWAQNGVAEMSRFRKDLEACRQQCGRL